MPEFSICIPTYEYKGRGVEFLSHLFETLERQTIKDYEVIISDHSKDDLIYNLCEEWGEKFDLKYYKNIENRGSLSQNTNMCFRLSTGKYIKTVYQDDFFYSDQALEKIKDVFETTSSKWLATACNHYEDEQRIFYRNFYPNFDNPISTLFGENLMSCPTVIAIRRDSLIEFDENLKMLMDCEFYYRMVSLGYKIGRVWDDVYHLEHSRTFNSHYNNPRFLENDKLWQWFRYQDKDAILTYYKHQDYLKERLS